MLVANSSTLTCVLVRHDPEVQALPLGLHLVQSLQFFKPPQQNVQCRVEVQLRLRPAGRRNTANPHAPSCTLHLQSRNKSHNAEPSILLVAP